MNDNVHQCDAAVAAGDPTTVTVQIPVDTIRRAEAAASEYADYGSNDREHEALEEIVAAANEALGYAAGGTYDRWLITIRASRPLTVEDIDRVSHADIPCELVDTLQAQADSTLRGVVDDETLGVAQAAANDLINAVRRVDRDARIESLKPAGSPAAGTVVA